jgi:hypothetical protein
MSHPKTVFATIEGFVEGKRAGRKKHIKTFFLFLFLSFSMFSLLLLSLCFLFLLSFKTSPF